MAFCLPITGINMENLLSDSTVKIELASPSINIDQDLLKQTTPENGYSLSFQNISEKHAPLLNLSQSGNLLSLSSEDKNTVSQPSSHPTLSNLLNLSNFNSTAPLSPVVTSLLTKLPFLQQTKQSDQPKCSDSLSTVPTTCLPLPIPSNLPLLGTLNPQILSYQSTPQTIPEILAKLAATKTPDSSTESSGLAAEAVLAKLAGAGLVSPNLSSLQIPDLASNIKLESQKNSPFSTNGNG